LAETADAGCQPGCAHPSRIARCACACARREHGASMGASMGADARGRERERTRPRPRRRQDTTPPLSPRDWVPCGLATHHISPPSRSHGIPSLPPALTPRGPKYLVQALACTCKCICCKHLRNRSSVSKRRASVVVVDMWKTTTRIRWTGIWTRRRLTAREVVRGRRRRALLGGGRKARVGIRQAVGRMGYTRVTW